MILDNEEQRKILLDILNSITIHGQVLDITYKLKQSIISATINENPTLPI